MRLGLYSKQARSEVNAARAFVAEHGYAPKVEDIRRARQDLLALPDGDPARQVANYLDFYTTSESRDMLFHMQEQQVTLPEIAAFIAQNGVAFVGFVAAEEIMRRFQNRFPQDRGATDLELWHAFETEHPDTFAGMYQFWIRKAS